MKRLLYITFIPAILWMMVIYGFSGEGGTQSSSLSLRVTRGVVKLLDIGNDMPKEQFDEMVDALHTPVRKIAHMTEYALLFFMIYIPMLLNFSNRFRFDKKLWIITLSICIVYASIDEIHQLYVEGRDGRAIDVLIDSIGATIAGLFFICIHKLANCKIVRKCK